MTKTKKRALKRSQKRTPKSIFPYPTTREYRMENLKHLRRLGYRFSKAVEMVDKAIMDSIPF